MLEAAAGDLAAALEQVEQAASLYRWEDHHLVLAARLLFARSRNQQALDKLRSFRGRYYAWGGTVYHVCRLKSDLGSGEPPKDCWELATQHTTVWARSSVAYRGDMTAFRALCLIQLGDETEARRAIKWTLALEPEREDVAYVAAATYSMLGDSDTALRWLRAAVDRGHQELWWARVDPDLDPLRDDARFKRIMQDWNTHLRDLFE